MSDADAHRELNDAIRRRAGRAPRGLPAAEPEYHGVDAGAGQREPPTPVPSFSAMIRAAVARRREIHVVDDFEP